MKDFVHNLYDYEFKAETKEEELEEEQDDEIEIVVENASQIDQDQPIEKQDPPISISKEDQPIDQDEEIDIVVINWWYTISYNSQNLVKGKWLNNL